MGLSGKRSVTPPTNARVLSGTSQAINKRFNAVAPSMHNSNQSMSMQTERESEHAAAMAQANRKHTPTVEAALHTSTGLLRQNVDPADYYVVKLSTFVKGDSNQGIRRPRTLYRFRTECIVPIEEMELLLYRKTLPTLGLAERFSRCLARRSSGRQSMTAMIVITYLIVSCIMLIGPRASISCCFI
jgi:hypothetical protein